MLPDTVAAVAADAAAAVAAAAAAAAAQGRRSFFYEEPSFVDGTSPLPLYGERDGNSSGSQTEAKGCGPVDADDEWNGTDPEHWRYLRFLSGHWSPWTVTVIALNRQRLPPAAWREFRACKNLRLLHLENCEVSKIEFCSDLPNLQRLLLPHNQLRSLRGLRNLPRLEELCVKGNPIRTFMDLSQLSEIPSLRRLDLQAFDGSEWAPVCKERGYQEYVLGLFPRKPLEGWNTSQDISPQGASNTRLEILDGKRIHLPALALAVEEVAAAVSETAAASQQLRNSIQQVLASPLQDPHIKTATAMLQKPITASGGDLQLSAARCTRSENSEPGTQQRQAIIELLVPAEACQTVRNILSKEVQETLSSAEQLMQLVRRVSAESKRCAFALEAKSLHSA